MLRFHLDSRKGAIDTPKIAFFEKATRTGAVAIAAATSIPGTIVSNLLGNDVSELCVGHPSGTLTVGAKSIRKNTDWVIKQVTMSRSARRLINGRICSTA